MSFGDRLEKLRDERGISIRELARRIDVAPNTVIRWIRGEGWPRLDEAMRAAALFGVRLEYLAYEDAPPRFDEISEDERYLLRTWRATGISADAAVQRLLGRGGSSEGGGGGPMGSGGGGTPPVSPRGSGVIAVNDLSRRDQGGNGSGSKCPKPHK